MSCRDLASSTIHPKANSGVNFHTSIHRKELIKPKQDPHPKTGSTGASSSASSSQSDLHAEQAILSQEAKGAGIDIEISEATAQQIQAILDETLEKPMQESVEGEGSEEEEVPEEETAVLNREETEAAAIQGLRDALKSTDKEASVDIKVRISGSAKSLIFLLRPLSSSMQASSQWLREVSLQDFRVGIRESIRCQPEVLLKDILVIFRKDAMPPGMIKHV